MREALRQLPFLTPLNDAEIDDLLFTTSPRRLPEGAVLFQQGEPGDTMAIVLEGRLSVRLHGSDTEVAAVYPGETVGEMACVAPAPRSATVIATRPTTAIEVDQGLLDTFRVHNPAVAVTLLNGVIGAIVRRIHHVHARIEQELQARGAGADQPTLVTLDQPGDLRPLDAEDGSRVNLRALALFADASRESLESFVAAAPPRAVGEGRLLVREGDAAHSAFIIARGGVEVIRSVHGKQRLLGVLRPGQVAGQLAIVERGPAPTSLRARANLAVLHLRREAFEQLLAARNEVAIGLQLEVAKAGIAQLHAANKRLVSVLAESTRRQERGERRPVAPPEAEPAPRADGKTGTPRRLRGDEDTQAALEFMRTAVQEWGVSLADVDAVKVSHPAGMMTQAELRSREKR